MGVIQKQGIQNTIITYIGIIIGFINLLIVQPHFLSPDELGLTRVLFSFSTILSTLIPLGVTNIIIKYFPVFRNPQNGHQGFPGFILLFFFIGYTLISLLLFLFKDVFVSLYTKESQLFADYFNYVFPLSFFLGFNLVLTSYCFALFKTTIPSLINDILLRILSIVIIACYFIKTISLTQYVTLFVAIYGLQFIVLSIYILLHDRPSFKIDFSKLREYKLNEIVSFGLLLSIVSFSSIGIKYIDAVVMAKYLPLSLVAVYSIAAFIPTVIEAPLNSLDKIAGAKMAEAIVKNNHKEIQDIYYKSCKYLLVLGGGMFLGITINIKYLLSFLPPIYHQGTLAVFIISVGTLFNMLTGSNTSLIFNSGNDKQGGIMLILIMIGAIILNILLIPIYGLEGAAFATAISSFFYNLFKYIFIWYKFKLQPFDRQTIYILLLILCCWGVNWFIPDTPNNILNILFHSILICLLYLIVIYNMKVGEELYSQIPFINKIVGRKSSLK